MKWMQRILSAWLAACLVLSMMPAQVFAVDDMIHENQADCLDGGYEEDEVSNGDTCEIGIQNQSTDSAVNAEKAIPDGNEIQYVSMNDAALTLREQLKLHTAEIILHVQTEEYDQDTFWYSVFLKAVEHTKDPTEGDYLRYHISQLTATSTSYNDDNAVYVELCFLVQYNSSYEQEIALNAVFDSRMNQLDLTDKPQYRKIQDIYGYITSNISYDDLHKDDETYPLKRSAYAALVNGTCVCQGYANLFYRMALAAGIDCRIVTGTGNGENHAWNIVCLDGEYYNVDCTWDAVLSQAGETYQHFMKGEAGFADHIRDAEYDSETFHAEYPVSDVDYAEALPDSGTGIQDGDWTYDLINGECRITAYAGNDTDVVIPAMFGDYPVHTIGRALFKRNSVIQSLTISEGIRWIESEAITYCPNLKSIHYPSTVELYSFGAAGLSAVPYGCDNLETVTVADGNDNLAVYDGVLYSKNMKQLLYLPPADPREVLLVPDGVTAIGSDSCRDNCNLTKVILPDTVESIGYWSFIHSTNLEEINIPENCSFIGQYTFQNTSLKSIHIPASIKTIVPGAFGSRCRLQTITVDAGNPDYYVVDNALYFKGESGDSLIKYAGGSEQKNCDVPEGVTTIENYAFEFATNLKQITLPATLKRIAFSAFSNCTNLEEIVLPQGLESIENSAFDECDKLVNIFIPASVQYIGRFAFSSAKEIVFEGDAPAEMDPDVFWSAWDTKVFYPKGNSTWTNDIMQDYDGAVTWMPYCGDVSCYETTVTDLNCTNPGFITYCCSVCGDTYVFEEAATGHTYTNDQDTTCNDCGYERTVENKHTYEAVVTDPTCGEQGYTTYTCTECGDSYVDDYVEATGKHDFGFAWNDMLLNSCCVCGKTVTDHVCNFVAAEYYDDCTREYHSALVKCTICESEYTNTHISMHPHIYAYEITKENTETEPGIMSFTCQECGHTYTEEIIAGTQTVIKGNCNENLTWTYNVDTCELIVSGNGKMVFDRKYVKLGAMTIVPWEAFINNIKNVIIKDGVTSIDYDAFGDCIALESIRFESDAPQIDDYAFIRTTTLAIYPDNNTTWTEEILRDYGGAITWVAASQYCDHEKSMLPGKEATCTEPGITEGRVCSVCNITFIPQEVIPATGHKWDVKDCSKVKTCTVCGFSEGKAMGHVYDDNVDGTCNVCSVNRETVEIRQVTHMFRMYNPNTGEHFYTGSEVERQNLVDVGWQYEGVGFTFPANTGAPVHRLFQESTGEHLYTMNEAEKEKLMAEGWNYEGIAFNSAYDTEAVQHRLHNPNATVGAYHFTFSLEEKQNLIDVGWEYQGIGWYSCWK